MNPLDAMARSDIASEPAIDEQVRDPNEEELDRIRELASSAAQLQDEIKQVMGDRAARLSSMKKQLKEELLRFGLQEVRIAGRAPIELTTSNNRKATRKSIIETMQKLLVSQLGENAPEEAVAEAEKEGKKRALNLWNNIERTTSYSLSIPDPAPPDLESPY